MSARTPAVVARLLAVHSSAGSSGFLVSLLAPPRAGDPPRAGEPDPAGAARSAISDAVSRSDASVGTSSIAPGTAVGRTTAGAPLRALERTDLLQSVIGDLLPAFDELYFESRPQFLSLLRKRLKWKELDRLKRERPEAVTHEELLALEASLRDDHRVAEPLSALLRTEDEARVIAALHGLNESDRRLLRAELEGEDRAALAQELGVSLETLRQRIRRARVALMTAMAPEGGR